MSKLIDDNEMAKYLIANYSLSIGECNHLAMFIQEQKRAHGDMVNKHDIEVIARETTIEAANSYALKRLEEISNG